MKWKWFAGLTMVAFLLSMGAGPPLLQAGERDTQLLLNLLKKKGIITEEESQELQRELQTSAKQEKEVMKKEITEAAQKGDFLPGHLKNIKIGTTIFSEFRARSEDKGGTTTNEFALNRGYLTLAGKVNSWLGFNLTSDLFTSRDSADRGNGLELRMKYAYADLFFGNTVTELGMAHTPSDMYDGSIWPYRVQGKHYLDDNSIQSSSDFGANIRGTFGGFMDEDFRKMAGSTYAGKWGGYQVGLYNGGGYTNPENNTDKIIGGMVYFRPAPNLELIKGLVMSYYGMFGKSNANFTAAGKTREYPSVQVNLAQLAWQHKWFTLYGQYYWGKGTFTSTEEEDRNGWLVEGFVRIPSQEKMRVFGRYFTYDPNTNKSNNAQTTRVIGLSYDWTKEFMPFVAYEHRDFEDSTKKNYDQFQVGFQLKF